MFALKNQRKTRVLETTKGLYVTGTVKTRLGINSSGFLMKKNREPNPVLRLVSVIPTLVREREAVSVWSHREALSWSATVLEAAAPEQYSLRSLWLKPLFYNPESQELPQDYRGLSQRPLPNFPRNFGCCIRKQLFLMARRALPPEGKSGLNYSAPNCIPHRSDFRVDSPSVIRAPGWQMDPDSQIMSCP